MLDKVVAHVSNELKIIHEIINLLLKNDIKTSRELRLLISFNISDNIPIYINIYDFLCKHNDVISIKNVSIDSKVNRWYIFLGLLTLSSNYDHHQQIMIKNN